MGRILGPWNLKDPPYQGRGRRPRVEVKLSPRTSWVGGILAPGILERPAPSSPQRPGLVLALEKFPRVGSWCWRCPDAVAF